MEKRVPHYKLTTIKALVEAGSAHTTHTDHTIWQDVYRPSTRAGDMCLKLTVIDDVLIVSFKGL